MRLWQKIKAKYGEESIYITLCVLTREIGDLNKAIQYSDRFPEYKVAYRGDIKAAMADSLAQLELICERYGLCFEEARELGHMRFLQSDERDRRETDGSNNPSRKV